MCPSFARGVIWPCKLGCCAKTGTETFRIMARSKALNDFTLSSVRPHRPLPCVSNVLLCAWLCRRPPATLREPELPTDVFASPQREPASRRLLPFIASSRHPPDGGASDPASLLAEAGVGDDVRSHRRRRSSLAGDKGQEFRAVVLPHRSIRRRDRRLSVKWE
jgi:hypothetical protein